MGAAKAASERVEVCTGVTYMGGVKMVLNPNGTKFIIAMVMCFFWCDITYAATTNLDQAIEYYHNADFEKARKIFEEALKQKEKTKAHQIAFTYLALIEMANGNMQKAERCLSELLMLNPHLTLETMGNLSPRLQDYTNHPDFQRLFREVKSRDLAKPSGEIIGFKKKYNTGDTINFTVRASDDLALKKLTFMVKNSDVKKEWDTNEPSAMFKSSFSTEYWKPGSYGYSFRVDDLSGKSAEYNGHFTLAEPPDTTRPKGAISGMKDSYHIGETISYSVTGSDNEKIGKLTFLVNGSPIKKWNVGKRSFTGESSFPTTTWKAGTYEYVLLIEDENNNTGKYTGSFTLRSEEHEKLLQSLSSNISKYNILKEKEKRGENIASAIVPVLMNTIEDLKQMLASYKEFSLPSSEMKEKSERANNLLAMFKNELSVYEKNLGEMIKDLKE